MRSRAFEAARSGAFLCVTMLAAGPAAAQLTIRVTSVPTASPTGATIYIAGNFNEWNPAAPEYALSRGADGVWSITFPDSVRGPIEFKFTRGSWPTVETTASGREVANRRFTVPAIGASTLDVSIAGWALAARLDRDRQFLHDRLAGTRLVALPKGTAKAVAVPPAPAADAS